MKTVKEKRVETNRDYYPLLMYLSIFRGDRVTILRQKRQKSEKRMNQRDLLSFLLDSKRKRDIKTDLSFLILKGKEVIIEN